MPFKDKGTEGAHGCQELHLPRMKAPATLRSAALRESTPSGARSSSFAEEFKIRILLQTLPRSKCWEIIKHFSTLSELNKTHRGGRGGGADGHLEALVLWARRYPSMFRVNRKIYVKKRKKCQKDLC